MKRYARYSKDEDQLILSHLRDVNANVHREVLKRCEQISEKHLPYRSPVGIRDRWLALIGRRVHVPTFTPRIRDLDDLILEMSERARDKIKTRFRFRYR